MQKLEALILILELRARKPKYGTFADQYINSIASTRDNRAQQNATIAVK